MHRASTSSPPSKNPSTSCLVLFIDGQPGDSVGPRPDLGTALSQPGIGTERVADPQAALERLDLVAVDLVLAHPAVAGRDPEGLAGITASFPELPVLVLEPAEDCSPPALLGAPRNLERIRAAVEQAEMQRRIKRFNTRAMMFDDALDRMYLVHQPILRARTGCVVGHEALLRICGPRFVGAEPFLTLARELRREDEVDDRVRFLLSREFEDGAHFHTFFMNLHMDELCRGVLGSERDPLAPHASRVVLEFGHDLQLPEGRAVRDTLARIRALGYRLAIGDLSISRADLLRLRSLQPEIYKIGVSSIHRCDLDAQKRAHIREIVELAHAEGALVVAQGIERAEEREVAVELGADLLQGFLIGLPQASL